MKINGLKHVLCVEIKIKKETKIIAITENEDKRKRKIIEIKFNAVND